MMELPLYKRLDWFQKEAVEFQTKKQSCALYMEQGTGKTWVSFGIIERLLFKNPQLEGLVVGLLANLETTWWDQFRELFPQVNVTRDWEEYKKLPAPKLLLCHYEYLSKHASKIAKRKRGYDFIIVDESQRAKSRNTKSSRDLRKLRYASPNKIVLSGTPDDGDPIHYWAQFRFFAPDVFGEDWGDFDKEYLMPTGYMGKKRKMQGRMVEQFNKVIAPHVLVVNNDVLDLKPPRHVRVEVKMPDFIRNKYIQMEKHLVVEFKNEIMAARLPVTKTVKLQQIVSGFIYDEDHVAHIMSKFRLRRLKPLLIRHRKEPVVVFCKYVPEMDGIAKMCKGMGLRYATIRGGAKHKKARPQIQRDFQAGLYDVVIVQIRSGVGIDLYASAVAIFYSMGHSSIDFQQSKARVYRRGQEREVVYYYLMVKNSIDEDIWLALKDKRSVSKSILMRLKTRMKTRLKEQHHGQGEKSRDNRKARKRSTSKAKLRRT
jgi:SNF2 family DNA or RNA helicase